MNRLVHPLVRVLSLFFIVSFLVACKNSPIEESVFYGTDGDIVGDISYEAPPIVSLKAATSVDISNHVTECPAEDSGQICVTICHVPPGNPSKQKTKILPLPAVKAHLKHGGPHHVDKDYLGACGTGGSDDGSNEGDDSDSEGDNSGGGDGSDAGGDSSDGDDGSGSAGEGSDDGEEWPLWCLENLDIDSDCDGFADDSGEPLY